MYATFFVAAALSAFPLVSSNAVSCSRTYAVKAGDTCDGISAANNASTWQFAAVNAPTVDRACSNLQVDQTVCLGQAGTDCTETYIVKNGDTCDAITAAAQINSTILWANNPQLDSGCTNAYIGEVLCIAKSVCVPPAPANWPLAPVTPTSGTQTAQAAPQQTPANHESDEDIPECENADDDGEW